MKKKNSYKNVFYFPVGFNYGICFFSNVNDYFIFVKEDLERIQKHTWWGRKRKNGKYDAYTKIGKKTVYLTNYLMGTNVKNGEQCDHTNQEPRDNRKCNLRNCTSEMNKLNSKYSENMQGEIVEENGKFVVSFPKYIKDKYFDTFQQAESTLKRLNEFTYTNSQEIAKEIETYEFTQNFHYLGGVLEEINNLSEKNIYKRWLKRIEVLLLTSQITEEQAEMMLLDHIEKYKKEKFA